MDLDNPPADPIALLRAWLDLAEEAELPNPTSMTLATVEPQGGLSARVVLLKALDERGIVFYTNRNSRKGLALAADPQCVLVFHWDVLTRQVVVEGKASLVSDEESDAYFATRPRASQLGAWASDQSQPVEDRAALDAAYAEVEKRFDGRDVPRPPHWGGYRVSLDRMEFWLGRPFRLHDRVLYVSDGSGGWSIQRLFP
ncbi:MAG: pyridoxamine 5'-phosphate oxidase [Phycisphaerales bacterium]|nr:MAG: pyridoxamine 5'-phosphate oxidase [Phycisphaerales bacterium]